MSAITNYKLILIRKKIKEKGCFFLPFYYYKNSQLNKDNLFQQINTGYTTERPPSAFWAKKASP